MPKLIELSGREVLDSRGNPTVEATVKCRGGYVGMAKVPSGASRGTHEAYELRDGDDARFGGKGVLEAVGHVTGDIRETLLGLNTADQDVIDQALIELDGTPNKSRIGSNAILAVSLACARAQAASLDLPLFRYLHQLYPNKDMTMPVPQFNVINGGRHASNGLSLQEYHVIPAKVQRFSECVRMGVEIYQALRSLLLSEGLRTEVGDEAGFAPKLRSSEMVFQFLTRAAETAGYAPGVDVFFGIDSAATEFFEAEEERYRVDGAALAPSDLAQLYMTWRERYPLIYFEDPFAEDDWAAWQGFTAAVGQDAEIVGDDLYATSSRRIRLGISRKAANTVLIKPNQVGTLTETLQAIDTAQQAGQAVVISHRSGETEDTFIADLAVAVGASQIKAGAPARSERTAKYNRLLQIESETSLGLHGDVQAVAKQYQKMYGEVAKLQV